MKTKHHALLVHPVFLGCLIALLVNDLYLKYAFHSWLTGKLSDFTGLFVLAVALIALSPGYKKWILVLCGLVFCWWKSALSEEVIRFCTHRLCLPVHRVVDYTDYIALPVLGMAYTMKPYVYPASLLRPAFVYLSGILSLFAFCATSMPRYMQTTDTYVNKNIRTPLKRKEIRERFDQQQLPLQQDTAYYRPLYDQNVYVKTKDSSGAGQLQPVSNFTKGQLYYKLIPYDSAYTIPWLLIGVDTLKNIRFSMDETGNGKKRIIRLQSFLYDTISPDGARPDKWLRKKYRRPLVDKMKEMLK